MGGGRSQKGGREKRTEENYTLEQIEQKVSDKKEKYGGGDV